MNATIIVPSIHVDPLLVRCVEECAKTCPEAEIIALVDEDAGREQIEHLATVLATGDVTIAAKRNLAASRAGTPYLAFIDSDAYPAAGWLDNAIAWLESEPAYAAVGGPNVSPPVEPRGERYVGLAHQSFLVAGYWAFRRDPQARAREVDALPSCNLVVRKADYDAVGGMNEDLFTAEDTDFCRRFVASGRRIWFSSDVLVFHKNRGLPAFVIQRFTFGVAMVPLLQRGKAPNAIYTLISALIAAFTVFVASGPLGFLFPRWRRLWLATMAAYAVVVGVEGVRQARQASDVPGTVLALVIGNLAPGAGFVLKAVRAVPDLNGIYRNDR